MSESTCLDLAMAKPNMIIKSNIDSRCTPLWLIIQFLFDFPLWWLTFKFRVRWNVYLWYVGNKIIHFKEKGESKVPIFGQGGAIKRPPMDEMTWNFACRGLLRVYIDFWSSWGHTASIEAKPIYLTSGTFWVSNMYTQHPYKFIIKIWPHKNHPYWIRGQ